MILNVHGPGNAEGALLEKLGHPVLWLLGNLQFREHGHSRRHSVEAHHEQIRERLAL